MTPEEKNPKVHHQTVRAARNALAKKQISRGSYDALLRGELTVQEARNLGREASPEPTDAGEGRGRATEIPERQAPLCLCGCGQTTRGGRFKPGHDARLHGELKRNLKNDVLLRNERFTDEQKAYAKERGLI